MKRYTKVIDGVARVNTDNDTTPEMFKQTGRAWKNSIERCLDQLANYEDTGLTPEEIVQLKIKASEEPEPIIVPFEMLKQEYEQQPDDDAIRLKFIEFHDDATPAHLEIGMRTMIETRAAEYNRKGGWRVWSAGPSQLEMETMPWN